MLKYPYLSALKKKKNLHKVKCLHCITKSSWKWKGSNQLSLWLIYWKQTAKFSQTNVIHYICHTFQSALHPWWSDTVMLSLLHVVSEISLFQSHCFCFFVHLFLKLQTNVETCSLHATHVTLSPDISSPRMSVAHCFCVLLWLKSGEDWERAAADVLSFITLVNLHGLRKKCCLTLKKQNKTVFRKKRCSKLVFIMSCKSV